MDKPEALRLADELDAYHTRSCHKEAAAELRRQHGEIKSMRAERLRSERRLSAVEAQRDALLEKIKAVIAAEQSEGRGCGGFIKRPPTREYQRRAIQAWQELHAAIKAVEEGK